MDDTLTIEQIRNYLAKHGEFERRDDGKSVEFRVVLRTTGVRRVLPHEVEVVGEDAIKERLIDETARWLFAQISGQPKPDPRFAAEQNVAWNDREYERKAELHRRSRMLAALVGIMSRKYDPASRSITLYEAELAMHDDIYDVLREIAHAAR